MSYATTKELNEFMFMNSDIPNPSIMGDLRLLESVSEGDTSTARFYLDNAFVIAGTYTLYYGVTESAALTTPLTETTHYVMDKDLGVFTLTGAGITLVAANNIYAAYSFNKLGIKDSYLQDVLDRSDSYINKKCSTQWVDGSLTTPSYASIVDEKHTGRGNYNRAYFLSEKPLPDVSTLINGAVSSGAVTLTVDSTAGFPSSGYLGIGNLKIAYTGKGAPGLTFTGVTGVTADIADNSEVFPFVFEASNTIEGAEPVYTVLKKGHDYDLELSTGRVYFSQSEFNVTDAQAWELNPPKGVPNRFRATYIWGDDTIPQAINQLSLMLSSKDLLHLVVRKAHSQGLNEFNPSLINVDDVMIASIMATYKRARMGTTA